LWFQNYEFQRYVNDRANSWTAGGMLNIRPTLSQPADEEFSTRGMEMPITSARLRTKGSFSFKYGRLETMARMPAGDWIWPGKFQLYALYLFHDV
jgi:beta-glucanase (GH16 family)